MTRSIHTQSSQTIPVARFSHIQFSFWSNFFLSLHILKCWRIQHSEHRMCLIAQAWGNMLKMENSMLKKSTNLSYKQRLSKFTENCLNEGQKNSIILFSCFFLNIAFATYRHFMRVQCNWFLINYRNISQNMSFRCYFCLFFLIRRRACIYELNGPFRSEVMTFVCWSCEIKTTEIPQSIAFRVYVCGISTTIRLWPAILLWAKQEKIHRYICV